MELLLSFDFENWNEAPPVEASVGVIEGTVEWVSAWQANGSKLVPVPIEDVSPLSASVSISLSFENQLPSIVHSHTTDSCSSDSEYYGC